MLLVLLAVCVCVVECVWMKYDYQVSSQFTKPFQIINSAHGNGPTLPEGAMFGFSVANLGDLNGDSVEDFVVGAIGESCSDDDGAELVRCGAVYILFMRQGALVESHVRITNLLNGGPQYLQANDNFGHGVAPAGDVDGDGIVDLVVGAPGTYTGGSLYVFFMNSNGTARSHTLIRGAENGNGPPVKHMGRFASSMANIGDLDLDGKDEVAVGMADFASGRSRVYILSFHTNGTVSTYKELILQKFDGSVYTPLINTDFGYAIANVGDINGDGIDDVAVGARKNTDPKGVVEGGAIYVCMMNTSKEVLDFNILTDASPEEAKHIALEAYDWCGAGIASIGDFNRDDLRARYPNRARKPSDPHFGQPSIPDMVVGCPQTDSLGDSGKYKLFFMAEDGVHYDTIEPPYKYPERAPQLRAQESFGAAIAKMSDLDGNGLQQFMIGAPGGVGEFPGTGSLYVIFLRRRAHHPPSFNVLMYWLQIIGPLFGLCMCCIIATVAFFIYFRRKPTDIELAVKNAGLEIGLQRKREKLVKPVKVAAVYSDDYE
mmetsp:Transcript_14591/g.21995  ORF Transcript_14591/g.21995 Transcript_14591/m.21995 type:complete len:544 (+) Transcript_14591:120-1751(+)